ncbi:alpha-tocopherol transfer protein-like [Anticarsia gemmatalis]|uniref:alpha-tocopherol transfer protein-like n=1 Tax=Anticarsia gemmatalis TaxID=129554 RepID=UPI003F768277
MNSLPYNQLLQKPPNALIEIRKCHNLDKPGRMKEAIDMLEEWIQKEEHILKKDFDRRYLETTIVCSKGSMEKSKKMIDRLCTMKTLLPQYFIRSNVKQELKYVLDVVWVFPLPKLTKDFYRVILVKASDKPITEEIYFGFFQYVVILCEYLKIHDYCNGFIVLHDFQEVNILDVVTKLSPSILQQIVSIVIEGYGGRIKSLNVLTQSKTVDLFVKMIKQFVSQKISSRLSVQRTLDAVYDVVPKELLPKEYGGEEKSCRELIDDWVEELSTEKHIEFMKTMRQACTNEKLRRSDKFNEEYLGMPGSFRNMTVD